MRQIVYDNERVGAWVAEQVKLNRAWGAYQAIGVEDDAGQLIAGVVYDGYVKGGRCSLHCAGIGRRWLTKRFLWMVFDYPFNQLGVNAIVNPVAADNEDSIRFTEHCGFTELATVRGGCGDTDLKLYVLYKENCRWLGLHHEENTRLAD